jgi:FolB domain-containing protein
MPVVSESVVRIRSLEVECVVGVFPHERHHPQTVLLDVDLWLNTRAAAETDRLSCTVDYDFLSKQLCFLLQNAKFQLLETAAHALCDYLTAPPLLSTWPAQMPSVLELCSPAHSEDTTQPRIEAARVTLAKPDALRATHARAIPSVTVQRSASGRPLPCEVKPFGSVEIVFENPHVGIYRLNIGPGQTIPLHIHKHMRESEMALTTGLQCQRRPVSQGTIFQWDAGEAHVYHNPSAHTQTVLCIDMPKFDPSDEIVVPAD